MVPASSSTPHNLFSLFECWYALSYTHKKERKKKSFWLPQQRQGCRAACCSAWEPLVLFSLMQISFSSPLGVFIFGWAVFMLVFFWKTQTSLLSSPSRNLTAARVRKKKLVAPKNLLKARRQTGEKIGMEQVTHMKWVIWSLCHSVVQGKMKWEFVKGIGSMVWNAKLYLLTIHLPESTVEM